MHSRFVKRLFWLTLPLRACDRVIAVSDKTRQEIHSRSGYPVDRIAVIPSVISPTFRPRQAEPNLPKPRILHVGLADNKNLDRHAAAIRGLNVHLRIIGEPSGAQHAMLKDNGIDYSCASKLSEEELQTEYANASLLLFCSTLEGYGMPIIEAQTIGVPVIASDRFRGKRRRGRTARRSGQRGDHPRPFSPSRQARRTAPPSSTRAMPTPRPVQQPGCRAPRRTLPPCWTPPEALRCTSRKRWTNQRSGFITILPSLSNRK